MAGVQKLEELQVSEPRACSTLCIVSSVLEGTRLPRKRDGAMDDVLEHIIARRLIPTRRYEEWRTSGLCAMPTFGVLHGMIVMGTPKFFEFLADEEWLKCGGR